MKCGVIRPVNNELVPVRLGSVPVAVVNIELGLNNVQRDDVGNAVGIKPYFLLEWQYLTS